MQTTSDKTPDHPGADIRGNLEKQLIHLHCESTVVESENKRTIVNNLLNLVYQ